MSRLPGTPFPHMVSKSVKVGLSFKLFPAVLLMWKRARQTYSCSSKLRLVFFVSIFLRFRWLFSTCPFCQEASVHVAKQSKRFQIVGAGNRMSLLTGFCECLRIAVE